MELNALLASHKAVPSMPKVVALLMVELDQPEPDVRKVSKLISADPGLTTRILQIANSAFFQLSRSISEVNEAVAILGLVQVRSLVSAVSLVGTFQVVQGINMQQFWRYSLNTAKLSRSLALKLDQNEATAFTSGLIHCVGELVMHLGMPEKMVTLDQEVPPLSLKRARAERRTFGYCYASVGAGFARKWNFPQAIVDALEYQYAPFENDVYEPLAGIIHLSAWRARAKEANLGDKELAVTFPDTVGLALGLDIDMVLQQSPIDWTSKAEVNSFA
ncbi:HDOD domain-containing protein [Variovorax sp. VNK109]|uniref:HDOD domain-containing protein n=1 Tax=Variovorax sp. VNK109 TaxID=3400919 RepID=UPI003C095389